MSVLASIFGPRNMAGTTGNQTTLRNPAGWLVDWAHGGQVSTSGERVTPSSAMNLSVYFAMIRNIAEDVAKLPIKVYRTAPEGRSEVADHRVRKLLHTEPNPEMTPLAFRETLTHHALGWGKGCAEIERDGAGRPLALWPLHPSRVRLVRNERKQLLYEIYPDTGGPYHLLPSEVFHLHGLGGDGLDGYSIVRHASESLGLGLGLQRFGGAFFGNGMTMNGELQHPTNLTEPAQKRLRAQMAEMHAGAANAYKLLISEEGMKFNRLGVPPEEGQFLQSREFSVEDICRWARFPPHKLGHLKRAQGWSTLEATNADYVTDTLTPWTTRWEQEIARKLLGPSETDLYAEHIFAALLRGLTKDRYDAYRIACGGPWMLRNEIRRIENMEPVDGFDEPVLAQGAPAPGSAPGPRKGEDRNGGLDREDDEDDEDSGGGAGRREKRRRTKRAFMPVFADLAARQIRKEVAAAKRAVKAHGSTDADFGGWLDRWYGVTEGHIIESFGPACESLWAAMGARPESSDMGLQLFAAQHVQRSKQDLVAARAGGTIVACLDDWTINRAPRMAEQLIEQIAAR